jgi:hypothetical protein
MAKAVRLVLLHGWRMDDAEGGRNSWVVGRWDSLASARLQQHVQVHAHCGCPICCETFAPGDAVVNLPCNHNFHAVCSGLPPSPASGGSTSAREYSSGICAWLCEGQGTCPCCRADVLYGFTGGHAARASS